MFVFKNVLKSALKIKAMRSTFGIPQVDLSGIPIKINYKFNSYGKR